MGYGNNRPTISYRKIASFVSIILKQTFTILHEHLNAKKLFAECAIVQHLFVTIQQHHWVIFKTFEPYPYQRLIEMKMYLRALRVHSPRGTFALWLPHNPKETNEQAENKRVPYHSFLGPEAFSRELTRITFYALPTGKKCIQL